MHRTCREKLFESSPTSPSRTFERGRRRQRSVWGQVLSQIKITLCNRRRGGPCGGAEGDGSEDLHTEYGVKSLSKPRRGGGRGHYLNVRVILIADNGYPNQNINTPIHTVGSSFRSSPSKTTATSSRCRNGEFSASFHGLHIRALRFARWSARAHPLIAAYGRSRASQHRFQALGVVWRAS